MINTGSHYDVCTQGILKVPSAIPVKPSDKRISKILHDFVEKVLQTFGFSFTIKEESEVKKTKIIPNPVKMIGLVNVAQTDSDIAQLNVKIDQYNRMIKKIIGYMIILQSNEIEAKKASPMQANASEISEVIPNDLMVQILPQDLKTSKETQKIDFPLPPEISAIIFSYYSNNLSDLGRISRGTSILTSSFLRSICTARPTIIQQLPYGSLSRDLIQFIRFHPTRLVQRQRQKDLKDKDLLQLSKVTSKLTDLSLEGGDFSSQAFSYFLSKCPNLVSIEFYNNGSVEFNDFIMLLCLRCPKLKNLKIVNCPKMTDEALFTLAALSNKICSFEYVQTSNNSELTDFGFNPFIMRSINLHTFKVHGCPQVTNLTLDTLMLHFESPFHSGRTMKEVGFSCCGVIENRFSCPSFESCPDIEKLELGFPHGYTLDVTDELNSLAELKKIRSFIIRDSSSLNDDIIAFYLESWEHLESLEIYRCEDCTPEFMSLLSISTKLRSFKFEPANIPHTPPAMIPDSVFKALCHNGKLETLDFANCQISQTALIEVLKGKTGFKNLRLYNCGTFDDALLKTLAEHCSRLNSLEIENSQTINTGITDGGIAAFTRKCRLLTILHLKFKEAKDEQITAMSLFVINRNCRSLFHLSLINLNIKNFVFTKELSSNLLKWGKRFLTFEIPTVDPLDPRTLT